VNLAISFEGDWKDDYRNTVASACLIAGSAIGRFTQMPQCQAFNLVFDGLVFVANPRLKKYWHHGLKGMMAASGPS